MTAADELERLFQDRRQTEGPIVPSLELLDRIAELLGEIRAAAGVDTHHGKASMLDWNTPAMDDAPVGMAISGPAYQDNPIYYVNETFETITGYQEADLLGGNLRVLQGPETDPEPVADIREALDIWAPVIVELRNYRADGTMFWNRLALAPIADETGTISNWVGLQEAITDRRS